MRRFTFLGFLCLTVLVCGCATVNITKTAKGYSEATNPNNIDILMTKPERGFVELAAVTTTGWSPADTAKMHNSLRAKSAPLGADAVILLSTGMDARNRLWSTGVAIRYKDK